jgi:transcriptional regulator with XRE-family HTH domain
VAAEKVNATSRTAFAKLIELRRRHHGLSVEQLAKVAGVDLAELVALEREGVAPRPQALHQLARVLKLPLPRLMQLAGLEGANDRGLDQEAVRFAARSEAVGKLSPEEEEALEDFVKYLDRT